MDYTLRESAVIWLKERGFQETEVEELQRVLNVVGFKKQEDLVILPKNTSKRIAAVIYLLNLITDAEGKPLCCDKHGLIEIPDEAKQYYEEELELENLEESISKLQKVKFGRSHSSPKRRGTVKSERY